MRLTWAVSGKVSTTCRPAFTNSGVTVWLAFASTTVSFCPSSITMSASRPRRSPQRLPGSYAATADCHMNQPSSSKSCRPRSAAVQTRDTALGEELIPWREAQQIDRVSMCNLIPASVLCCNGGSYRALRGRKHRPIATWAGPDVRGLRYFSEHSPCSAENRVLFSD